MALYSVTGKVWMVYTTIVERICFNVEYGWYNVLSVFRSWGNTHSWLPQVRKWSGKSQGISLLVRENLSLWRKSGKSKILRVYIYSFLSTFIIVWHLKLFCSFYGRESHCIVRMLFMVLHAVLTDRPVAVVGDSPHVKPGLDNHFF